MHKFFSSLVFKIGIVVVLLEIVVLLFLSRFHIDRFGDRIDSAQVRCSLFPGRLIASGQVEIDQINSRGKMEMLTQQKLIAVLAVNLDFDIEYSTSPDYITKNIADITMIKKDWLLSGNKENVTFENNGADGNLVVGAVPVYRGGMLSYYILTILDNDKAVGDKAFVLKIYIYGSIGIILLTILFVLFLHIILTKSKARALREIGQANKKMEIFKKAVEFSTDAVGMATPQGKHYYQNKAFDKLFGKVGSNPAEQLYVDTEIGNEVFATIMAGKAWKGEVQMYGKEKQVLDILLRAYSTFDEKGNVTSLFGVHTDITERKKAEKALLESEQRFHYLADAAIEAIFISKEGICLEANTSAAKMFGYDSTDELIGIFGTEVIAPESKGVVRAHMMANLKDPYDAVGLRKDGSKFPISIYAKTMPYKNYGDVRVTAVRDMSELMEAKERFRLAAQAASDLIYEWDVKTNSLEWFGDVFGMLGYGKDEIPNSMKGWMQLIHPEDLDGLIDTVQIHKESSQPIFEEYRVKKKDGTWMYWQNSGNPVLDNESKPIKWIGVCKDITDQVLAMNELVAERKFSDSIVKSMPGLFYVIDRDDNFIKMNENWVKLTGFSEEELSRMTALDTVEDKDLAAQKIEEVFSEGYTHMENNLLTKDGRKIPFLFTGSLLSVNENKYLVGMGVDVSKRKEAEKALGESEKRFRTIFDLASDAMHLLDRDCFVACNRKAIEMYGFESEEDMIGTTPREISPVRQPDGELSEKKVYRYIKGAMHGEIQRFNWRHTRFDNGKELDVEVCLTPIELDGRQYLLGVGRDITSRLRMETELKNLRHYLSNIIDSMPSVLVGVDSAGRITLWNRTAEEATGMNLESANGRLLEEVFPHLGMLSRDLSDGIKRKEVIESSKIAIKKDDGLHYEDITVYPLVANSVTGAVIRIDDVTEKIKLEEQLNQSRKMDAIGQLAGGVAHDFNNMLSAIITAAELLMYKEDMSDDNRDLINMILKSSTRAADLTAKLLAFARKGKISSTDIELHKVIDDTVSILSRTLDKKIRLKVQLDAFNEIITGDSSALQNAFFNICINAGQAMPEGGSISIETRNTRLNENYCHASVFDIEPGEYIEIEIRDTGAGIPRENIKRIFEPFFTTKELGKGTGLGLAAVYGTIQEHHGAINVYSEVGEGTAFHILLPVSETDSRIQGDVPTRVTGAGKILLVDDEELIRITGKYMLKEMGYQVIVAENGLEGLKIFKAMHDEIDLVIMDMIMPEMNGREAFLEMKKIDENCKVVISSGFSKNDGLSELRGMGLAGFIRKPYRDYEMSRLLADLIGGSDN